MEHAILGYSTSEKVAPPSWLGRSEWKFVFPQRFTVNVDILHYLR